MRLTEVSPVQLATGLLATLLVLLAGASPAGATTGLLAADRPWHYWISIVLMASVLGLFGMLALGYVVKVVFAKYGIKVGRRHAG